MTTKISKISLKIEGYLLPYLTFLVSLVAFLYFFKGGKHLLYADAISRLNIARKIVDNLTPGFAQVGNVWLPLPQLLMLPFIWNDQLWRSGIAGYLMSGPAFILCAVFIYKSAKLITNSVMGAAFSASLFVLNINALYLQTTAMSESLFMCSLAATMYYFLRWFKDQESIHLIYSAAAIYVMTLTRYEGLAVLLSSIPMVFLFSLITSRKFQKAEGSALLFSYLACLGFLLWTLYLTAIFGDPLYWRTYYATPQATGGAQKAFTQAKPLIDAVWQYFTSFVWMNGVIPTVFSIIGIFVMLGVSIKKRSWQFMPMLMPLSIFAFMVMTLQRNTPIVQPNLTIENILSSTTSTMTGFNIRYGLLMLPWVAIMASYVFLIKPSFLKIVLFLFFSVQVVMNFYPKYTLVYSIPARIYDKPFSNSVNWLRKNYDGGKILVSASSKEDQMFALGFPYRTYIHEGTGKYWKESLDNPSRYAKWVIIDYGHNSDNLAKHMNREDILEREYKVVFEENQTKIYKKITNPYFSL